MKELRATIHEAQGYAWMAIEALRDAESRLEDWPASVGDVAGDLDKAFHRFGDGQNTIRAGKEGMEPS